MIFILPRLWCLFCPGWCLFVQVRCLFCPGYDFYFVHVMIFILSRLWCLFCPGYYVYFVQVMMFILSRLWFLFCPCYDFYFVQVMMFNKNILSRLWCSMPQRRNVKIEIFWSQDKMSTCGASRKTFIVTLLYKLFYVRLV